MRDWESKEMLKELESSWKNVGHELCIARLQREIKKLYKPLIKIGHQMGYGTHEDIVYMKAIKDVETIIEKLEKKEK